MASAASVRRGQPRGRRVLKPWHRPGVASTSAAAHAAVVGVLVRHEPLTELICTKHMYKLRCRHAADWCHMDMLSRSSG